MSDYYVVLVTLSSKPLVAIKLKIFNKNLQVCNYLAIFADETMNKKKGENKMKMTKEQALQWLKEVKQNKKKTIDKMTDWLIKDFEKRTGEKPTYIETL